MRERYAADLMEDLQGRRPIMLGNIGERPPNRMHIFFKVRVIYRLFDNCLNLWIPPEPLWGEA